MLVNPNRARAFHLLVATGLHGHLWHGCTWTEEQIRVVRHLLPGLPADVSFELALAVLLSRRHSNAIADICRKLTCSNEQRETTVWLAEHQADLDAPAEIGLAELKRLMAHAAFAELRTLAHLRYRDLPDGASRLEVLARRLASIRPEAVTPPAWVTGADLQERGIAPGPVYGYVLDKLYTAQLNETLPDRVAALQMLERLLGEVSSIDPGQQGQ
jgi:hypothetical protein